MSKDLTHAISFPGKKPLKDVRREKFCREYTRHGDKQRAVVAAGFNCKTWEEGSTSASAWGCSLMKEEQVLERVQYLQEWRHREADLDEVRVLKELKRIAFFDIGGLYNPDGSLKSVKDWSEDVRRVVSEVQVDKIFSQDVQIGVTAKVKTNSKVKALEKLMEYFHMVEPPAKAPVTAIQNQQVNIYLPENRRHAKADQPQSGTHVEAAAPSNGHGLIELPTKTNGSH